jgi:gluconate 2-dehydrogenase gamma chain
MSPPTTPSGRRTLLRSLGIGTAAAQLPRPPTAQANQVAPGFTIFSAADVSFLRAAVDRLIPPDEFPGAADAGVVDYIDRQLAGPFGEGARTYRAGPFQPGTPGQGYQLPLTPRELYRESLDALTSHLS